MHHGDEANGFMDYEMVRLAAGDPDLNEDDGPHWRSGGQRLASFSESTAQTKTKQKAEERSSSYTYRDFVRAYQKYGITDAKNAAGIEKPVANPDIAYFPITLMEGEYQIRHWYIYKEYLKPLWWLIPLTIVCSITIPTLFMALGLLFFWWLWAVGNTNVERIRRIRFLESIAPVSAGLVNRMRRIAREKTGQILESDAAGEVLFAQQYYRRYLKNSTISIREYKILMMPFWDEAKAILRRADWNPDGIMNDFTAEMTPLFRYRLDPFAASDAAVREYCEKMSPVFDDTGGHVDYGKLTRMTPCMEEILPKYRDHLLRYIDNDGNPC